MSMADREAKWAMRWTRWPGQSRLVQKVSLSLGEADQGGTAARADGRERPQAFFRRLPLTSTGPTTSGITSPALRTTTVSPGPHVLRPHLVLVVQGGQGDGGAAHEHRVQHGEGCGLAGPPDGHRDPEQGRGPLLGGELVGDGPAGRSRRGPEPALEPEVVHLDHHPVDLVVELVAVGLPAPAELQDRRQPVDQGPLGIDREPGPVQPGQGVGVGGGQLAGQGRSVGVVCGVPGIGRQPQLPHLVGPEREGPAGGDRSSPSDGASRPPSFAGSRTAGPRPRPAAD